MSLVVEAAPSQDIERLIRARTAGRVKNLRVFHEGNRLILHGSSHTFYAKQLAQHAALQIAPANELLNEITVEPCD